MEAIRAMVICAVLWLMFFLGAIIHERDIARMIEKTGSSGTAGWTVTITCPETWHEFQRKEAR
jgi:hypothetical protein